MALIQTSVDDSADLLYLDKHGVSQEGDICDSANLQTDDKISTLLVFYNNERVTSLKLTTFAGFEISLGSALGVSSETIYFNQLD
jgi:hypothetical protein